MKELCGKDAEESCNSVLIRPFPPFIGIGHTVEDFVLSGNDSEESVL